MPIEIGEFQFSSIWSETTLILLEDPAPAAAPLKELGRDDSYKPLFEKVLAVQHYRTGTKDLPLRTLLGSHPFTILAPPWPQADGQHFWQRYLNILTLDYVTGAQAWNGLVPFRAKFPCKVEPTSWGIDTPAVTLKFFLESFFYPHGVTFVFTVRGLCGLTKLSLAELVALVFSLRKKKYKTQWKGQEGLFSSVEWDDTPGNEQTLDSLATEALTANKIVALGPSSALQESSVFDPFTILSVVQAVVPDPGKPIDEEVHRVLDRVTGWGSNPFATLPPLDNMKVNVKSDGPGRVLYCRERGRAVWFPDLSTDSSQQHLLRCYHRNLTLASMHVESLSGVVSATAARIKQQKQIPAPLRACAIKAAGSLGRLYGNQTFKKTYRSLSLAKQMEQNKYVDDVNLLRKTFAIGSGKPVGAADPDQS
jgi:hypothetical protein